MNKRQALAATFAVPIIAFVILLPPHRVTGSIEAHPKPESHVVSLSLGKTWVLRPHGSAQSVTLDIDAAVFTAVSRREYELMVWPWVGSLLSVLALALGALFVLRSPRRNRLVAWSRHPRRNRLVAWSRQGRPGSVLSPCHRA